VNIYLAVVVLVLLLALNGGDSEERESKTGDGAAATTAPDATATTAATPPSHPPPGTLLRHDPTTDSDPTTLWTAIHAEDPSRQEQFDAGGPNGGPFRRMTVQDGDDYEGERAELGYNSRVNGLGPPEGTFFLYNTGERRVTSFWMRLPADFPIDTPKWQVVTQMKQTGPAENSDGTPVLALEAREGRWVLTQSNSAGSSGNTHELWSTPATLNTWTPVKLDVTYSPDPKNGEIQVTVGKVKSPTFTTYTQKYEIPPGGEGLDPGQPIPSHLRMGIYHDPSLPGTSVDFADVRVSS